MKTKSRDDLSAVEYEKLADLAEAGFDPATFKKRRGRPSIGDTAAGEASPRMATRVSPSVKSAFVARAAAEGKSPSEALRELMERYAGGPAESKKPALRRGR